MLICTSHTFRRIPRFLCVDHHARAYCSRRRVHTMTRLRRVRNIFAGKVLTTRVHTCRTCCTSITIYVKKTPAFVRAARRWCRISSTRRDVSANNKEHRRHVHAVAFVAVRTNTRYNGFPPSSSFNPSRNPYILHVDRRDGVRAGAACLRGTLRTGMIAKRG